MKLRKVGFQQRLISLLVVTMLMTILIVAVTTDEFTRLKKDKKCYFSNEQRKGLLESVRFVDLVIPEENWDQKIKDIKEYHIDTFVIGDDWKGKFDYREEWFWEDRAIEIIDWFTCY